VTDRIATAVIARWIDPDTLVCGEMDLGWGVAIRDDPRRQTTHIRLAGVNAPDSRPGAKWYDPVLKQAGLDYCNAAWPPGTAIILTSHELDSFGRSLADVVIAANGTSVAFALVSLGYARTGDYPVPEPET
jgi:endonuclease YncB( thermonuclease family)